MTAGPDSAADIEVALLTGGFDRPYAFGLTTALAERGVTMDVIGANDLEELLQQVPQLTFFNLYEDRRAKVGRVRRLLRHLAAYVRLLRYAACAKPQIFHVLWNNRLQLFDRTFLMLYYKALGKRIVLTAHNVNAGQRDGSDSVLNRLSLRAQYLLVDHIFVHTDKMKRDLMDGYAVASDSVSVIPFGINNSVPDTDLTPAVARGKLELTNADRTILFFGNIRPYKGVEYLVEAFQRIALHDLRYRLIIAGEPKEAAGYWNDIQKTIEHDPTGKQVIQDLRYIGDEETEFFFKAADVLVLPYTHVYQSGVLFLAYSFGLPVIATDVGALRQEIVEGKTGYIARPCDGADLANKIQLFFASSLYTELERNRMHIKAFAHQRNSWTDVSRTTCKIYRALLTQP